MRNCMELHVAENYDHALKCYETTCSFHNGSVKVTDLFIIFVITSFIVY